MADAARGATAISAGGLALAALCAQQFNMSYDTVGMNVALSDIVEDLDTTLAGMQAAIAMYAVVMAAFMITGAKLADRWGRRRTFMSGTAIYGLGSGITALSPNLASLVFGWSVIEGLGSAFAQPALTAQGGLGRALAVTEGLLGQIYLVTAVAALVSNMGRERGSGKVPEKR